MYYEIRRQSGAKLGEFEGDTHVEAAAEMVREATGGEVDVIGESRVEAHLQDPSKTLAPLEVSNGLESRTIEVKTADLPDHPEVAEAAHVLRKRIARWRDDLVGRQRSGHDDSRAKLIERLAEQYDAVEAIALQYEPE